MPCVAGMFKAITPIKTVVSPQRKVYAHFISTSAKESNFLNFVSPQRKVYAHFISTSAKESNCLNFVSPQRKVYAHFISTSTCHKRWSERSPNQPTSKKEEKPGGESEKRSPGGVGHRPLMDIKALKEAPKPALWLGAGGLIPFIVPPVAMLLTGYYVPQIHESQVVYGATILSFLGGARWGVAVVKDSGLTPTWASLGYSVTLPLLAWLSLTLSPSIDIKTSIIILGLTLSLFNDIFAPGYARWFKSLRVILTFVATFSLALVNIAYEAVKEGRMLESDLKNFQI